MYEIRPSEVRPSELTNMNKYHCKLVVGNKKCQVYDECDACKAWMGPHYVMIINHTFIYSVAYLITLDCCWFS